MKITAVISFIVALCLLIIPFCGMKKANGGAVETLALTADVPYYETDPDNKPVLGAARAFRIKTESGIEEIDVNEYVFGVVAAEMSASAPAEALKAQAVAAYSFALYRSAARKEQEYDLTDSFKTDQSFIKKEKLKEKWGENYDAYAEKINKAITEVKGEYLSYDGAVALALYHAVSPGRTNSCKEVFGGDKPYLVPVESECDKLSPDYKSVFSLSEDELKGKLSALAAASGEGNLFSDIKTGDSGLVLTLRYCGETFSGTKVAGLLGLSSAAFSIEYAGGAYTFTCIGRGHGVGMSQYGAKYLAEGGSTYREILLKYYPGTAIKKSS